MGLIDGIWGSRIVMPLVRQRLMEKIFDENNIIDDNDACSNDDGL